MLKHFGAKILFLGLSLLVCPVAAGQMTPRQALYYHAERGNKGAIAQLQQMGYLIDVADEYGNSALCEAVIKRNTLAIQTLVQMGADTEADCLQALSADMTSTQTAFIFSGEANQKDRLAPKEISKVPNPPAEPLSKNTKVGIGLGVTTALIAGGVTAALIGGGGGSDAPVLNCVDGKQVGEVCQCNEHATGTLCEKCESGYDFFGTNTCHEIKTCKINAHQIGDTCQCDEGYTFQEDDTACYKDLCSQFKNMHQVGSECVCDTADLIKGETGCYARRECPENSSQRNNTCVCNASTPVPTYENGELKSCTACGDNMIYVGKECVCKTGFPFKTDDGCYAIKDCHHGKQNGDHCDCNPGWADDGTNYCSKCADGFTLVNGECKKVVLLASTNTNTSEEGLIYSNTGDSAHDADIIGLYGGDSTSVSNAQGTATRKITITNEGKGSVYGMYGTDQAFGSYHDVSGSSSSTINITNSGTTTYGIYGVNNAYGTYHIGTTTTKAESTINIKTSEIGTTVYGIYSTQGNAVGVHDATNKKEKDCSGGVCSKSTISIHNSLGTSYGLYSAKGTAMGADDTGEYTEDGSTKERSVSSVINLYQWGGVAYGMYGKTVKTTDGKTTYYAQPENTINIQLIGREATGDTSYTNLGTAIGMYASSGGSIYNTKTGVININLIGGNYTKKVDGSTDLPESVIVKTDDTAAIGIYADPGISVTNAGEIHITRNEWKDTEFFSEETKNLVYTPGTSGIAYGIYVAGTSSKEREIENIGTIKIDGDYDIACGIYVDNGNKVTVKNLGTILIESSDGYGIYFRDGSGGKVINSGTIAVGIDECTGDDCNNGTRVLTKNGATFENTSSTTPTGTSSLNLSSLAETVVAQSGSTFAADDTIAGTLHIDTDVVAKGFNDTYTEHDMIKANDTSSLKLVSDSALFDARLEGSDVIMKRKDFESVTSNKSLADFLTHNYTKANGEAFYNKLKSFGNMNALGDSLNKLTGKEMLSRFNFEDMTMMRELNFDMNEKLFHNKEQHFALSASVSPMAFKGDTGSNARYSLYNKREGNKSIGLGIAFTDIRSDDSHESDDRHETSYQLILPMGYKTNGFNLITSPRIGYARGTYDRTGFDNSAYDGIIEKRVFGLMNEARYPMIVGSWKLEPSVEFNILGYQQKGHEDAKEFALNIQNQNTLSVEGGIGLYATHEAELDKGSSLKLSAGIAAYHEFADPYRVKIGMNGMEGAFTLRDENRSQNRGVIRAGFDYVYRDLSLYGSLISYIDKEARTLAKTGMKVQF